MFFTPCRVGNQEKAAMHENANYAVWEHYIVFTDIFKYIKLRSLSAAPMIVHLLDPKHPILEMGNIYSPPEDM